MKLAAPEIHEKDDQVLVSARVSFRQALPGKPERAWFAYPAKYAALINGKADAFAASLFPLALALGEDLESEAPISPRLARGLQEYQLAFHQWYPSRFTPVAIHTDLVEPSGGRGGAACAALFSGGVDSAYTLMTHMPAYQAQPAFQVKYALFIHGLDIPLQKQENYAASRDIFTEQLAKIGVELIACSTNLRYFSSGLLKWNLAHGGVLAAAGLLLDPLVGTLLIPSSYSLDELIPWGSSPMIDYLLSTESMKVVHHGITLSRIEKVEAISQWQPAHKFLRVCIDESHQSGVMNCSRCEKCLRTMTMLEMSGALPAFETFRQPFGPRHIARWTPHFEDGEVWLPDMIRFARRKQKTSYLLPLFFARLRGKIRSWIYHLIPHPLFQRLKGALYPYERDPFNPVALEPEEGRANHRP